MMARFTQKHIEEKSQYAARQMKHFSIIFKPDGRQISVHSGATIIEAAGQAGIILNTVCGGKGTCKKCLVYLGPDSRKVLACQHRIESDLTVTIPAESRFFEQRILTEGIETGSRIERDIYRKYLPEGSAAAIFGLAVDLGTTTVVAKLIDMAGGQCRATEAALNPQTVSATTSSAGSHTPRQAKNSPSARNRNQLHKRPERQALPKSRH
jgi:uncharacterized 2Fe-2S/4Fe-4S cluster protein (DUF4445 family)